MNNIKRALVSVWDKQGIVELVKFLIDNQIEVISTGGTKKILEENNLPVTSVSSITNQNEIMNGRVKTLHPNLFGGILADRENENHIEDLNHINAQSIDLVIINLYPFQKEAIDKKLNLEKSIEYIDIGGPSMLRAAAKNFKHVIPLCESYQYNAFIEDYKENKGLFSIEKRIEYAKIVFNKTMRYDFLINKYFCEQSQLIEEKLMPDNLVMNMCKKENLRYGENPHQGAAYYTPVGEENIWEKIQGKKLSYNNYFDMESAINIVYEFDQLCCVIVKHSNPCGFGLGVNNVEAYLNAVSTDPISYFGGVVAFNNEVNEEVATLMSKVFLECIIAPAFSNKAISILKRKKNLRLIKLTKDIFQFKSNKLIVKSVFNGFLYQNKDNMIKKIDDFNIVTKIKPNNEQINAILLGWKIVKSVKSNAIVINDDKKTLGIGAGQMSRIDSVKIAIRKSNENNLNLNGSIMASDAFFPFPDSLEFAAENGISGIIQPGGSIKDDEIIEVANKLNLFMILTNERHFIH